MRLWQYWLHYLASGLHNSVTKQRVLAFPLDQSDSVKVIELTSVLQNLRAAAPGRVHLCSVFNCRVIFCPCQHSARSNHPPGPPLPRRVSAAGTFSLRCQQFWDSEDIFAISALSPKLLSNLSAWKVNYCATSWKPTRACNCHSICIFFFLFSLKVVSLLELKLLRWKIFILLHFTYPTCFLFCSSLFIKAAFNQPQVLHRSLGFNWNIKAMN